MVYESDFYTTRRPYRPSTYSVSFDPISTYYPNVSSRVIVPMRTRIMTSPTPPYHLITVRVKPSVLNRELDRISHRHRPHYAYSPTEDFLLSDSSKRWEDETRRIRADTASLRQRIHSTIPRANHIVPLSKLSAYSDHYIPIRLTSDDYVTRLLLPVRSIANNIKNISWYPEPARKFTGRGHLACLRYVGSKAFSNRRSMYPEQAVRDDVTLLSFYAKNRLAAAGLPLDSVTVKLLPWRPTRRFNKPALMDDPALELKAAKAERYERFMAKEAEAAPESDSDLIAEKKKRQQEEAKLAEERALAEEMALSKKEAERRRREEEEQRAAERAEEEQLRAEEKAEEAAKKEKEAKRKAKEQAKLAEERRKAEEKERLAEEQRLAEEAHRAEQERLATEQERIREEELTRLAEIERQADEEKHADLARQAAELAELARQEAELAELEKQEAELARQEQEAKKRNEEEEAARKREEEEFQELARQEAELLELERQEAELKALEKQEAEANEEREAEARRREKEENELEELKRQEEELKELERQEAELMALEEKQQAELETQAEQEPASPQTDVDPSSVDAEFEALAKQEADLEELARQDSELEELVKTQEELKEIARQAAELAELDAEAKALADSAADGLPSEIDDEADNVHIEEPLSAADDHNGGAYISESENAEGDITDEE